MNGPTRGVKRARRPGRKAVATADLEQLEATLGECLLHDRSLVAELPMDPTVIQTWLQKLVADALAGEGRLVLVGSGSEQAVVSGHLATPVWTSVSYQVVRPVESFVCREQLSRLLDLVATFWLAMDEDAGAGRQRSRSGILPQVLPSRREVVQLKALHSWLKEGGSGLFADWSETLLPGVRRQASVSTARCLGASCPSSAVCPAWQERAKAETATISVLDHSTFLTQQRKALATAQESTAVQTVLVMLDSHLLPTATRRLFQEQVCLEDVRALLPALVEVSGLEQAHALWQAARALFDRLDRQVVGAKGEPEQPIGQWPETVALVEGLEQASQTIHGARPVAPERLARLLEEAAHAMELAGVFHHLLLDDRPDVVVSWSTNGAGVLTLHGDPVEVSEQLERLTSPARLVLWLSDQQAVNGRLEPIRRLLGVPETCQTLVLPEGPLVGSMLVVVPESLPEVNERGWNQSAAARFIDVVRAATCPVYGRFSSEAVLTHVIETARNLCLRIPSPTVLDDGTVCLDLPERAARAHTAPVQTPDPTSPALCVVIDRLPFVPPSDPVSARLRERDPRWFIHYALPEAILAFRQTLKALLRPGLEKLVVVVLDHRLLSRPYSRPFISCLEGAQLSRNIRDIGPFIQDKEEL